MEVTLGCEQISISDVVAVANNEKKVVLDSSPSFLARINKTSEYLENLWTKGERIYGVTTGYGHSCGTDIPANLVEELPLNLTRFHGCGMGKILSIPAARATMLVRLASFSGGYSGVRPEVFFQLCSLINEDIVPVIPEEGSVGASGDLTPLSYVAAVVMGEREVFYKGAKFQTQEVFSKLGIEPLKLKPKEGLALMNGTSVMTAIASLAYSRAEYLMQLASRITSIAAESIGANKNHFQKELFLAKPFPGMGQVASWISSDLDNGQESPAHRTARIQNRYSIRCAPHVIGVLADSMPWMKKHIETEINSANDNPLINGETEEVMHGGHFYGGHICFVMDSMKNAVANIADLLDRQLALLVDTTCNNGLPANLSASSKERSAINHGFKAVQIGVSSWTAEALKQTLPASIFSRSTECHNQDKVSMGTIAARDCMRVLELTEQVAAAVLVASVQAILIRKNAQQYAGYSVSSSLLKTIEEVEKDFEYLVEDRPLESCLRTIVSRIQKKDFTLYS